MISEKDHTEPILGWHTTSQQKMSTVLNAMFLDIMINDLVGTAAICVHFQVDNTPLAVCSIHLQHPQAS